MNNKNEYILRDLLEYASNKKQVNEQRVPEGVSIGDEIISVQRTTSDEGDGVAVKISGSGHDLCVATSAVIKGVLEALRDRDIATMILAELMFMATIEKVTGNIGKEIMKGGEEKSST